MSLPKMGTPEWEKEKELYQTGSIEEIHARAKELGMLPYSYGKRMNERGVHRKTAEVPPLSIELTELESSVLDIIRKSKSGVSVGELSRQVDRSSETIIKTLDSLRDKHYMVELDSISRLVELPVEPRTQFEATTFDYYRHFYRIGLISDTHLGSKYQQLTCLYDAYRILDEKDVDFILHAGDIVDGVGVYRGQHQELFLHNAEEQRKYVEDVYPKPKKQGLKTYMIGGQHDRSFYKEGGYDIVEHICEHRDDLVYRGFYSAQFEVKGLPIRLEHPGGGIAYARSYAPQKIVENMMGFINTIPSAQKPALLLMGHWHTPLHLPVYMGVDSVTLPCFQAQTPYMQQHKNMMPTVGCAVAEVYLNEDNQLSQVGIDFVIMNDRIKEKDW